MSGQTTTQRDPAKLKSHPLQRQFFPMPSDTQLAAMAETVGNTPVPQILPDGTVITACEWAYAMVSKGANAIDVIVREDLVVNDAEVERLFLLDKLANQMMSNLRLVWCLLRLKEIRRGWPFTDYVPGEVHREIHCDMQDREGLSPRQVNRLIQIARLPISIQQAFEAKAIDMKLACKVEALPDDVQKEIAKQIRDRGEDHAREIVEHHLSEASSDQDGDTDNTDKFIRLVDRFVNEFCGHEDTLHPGSGHLEKLERVEQLAGNLSRRIRNSQAQQDQAMAAVIAESSGPADDHDAHGEEFGSPVTSAA